MFYHITNLVLNVIQPSCKKPMENVSSGGSMGTEKSCDKKNLTLVVKLIKKNLHIILE